MLSATELRKQMAAPSWFVEMVRSAGEKAFWQVYLDNFMAGEVGPQDAKGEGSVALHREAVEIWKVSSVRQKSTFWHPPTPLSWG